MISAHKLDSDVFYATLDGAWKPVRLPDQAGRGNAAFEHPDQGLAFFQTVIGRDDAPDMDDYDLLERALTARLETLEGNGHKVEPGQIAKAQKAFGPIAVCDVRLDEGQRYGVMAAYAFPTVVLLHWMDGPPGAEAQVKGHLFKVIETVRAAKF
ncbi:MAG: hypothetical protein AAGJ85_06475 [Pseudomonadota bacterium]